MFPLPLVAALALAAGPTPPADPFPDPAALDHFSYHFTTPGAAGAAPFFGGGGALSVTRAGKVTYSHSTMEMTGSGGTVTKKEWDIPADEAAALFRGLVEGGLMKLPGLDAAPLVLGRWGAHFSLTSGRWQTKLAASDLPQPLFLRLRPYLVAAHPKLWGEKEPPAKCLWSFTYTLTPKVDGTETILTVKQFGEVTYAVRTHPTAPGGRKDLVRKQWRVPPADAEGVLRGLVAGGVLDLKDNGGGKTPNHAVEAVYDRWTLFFHPDDLPPKVLERLRPYLAVGEPERWKGP